MPLLKCPVARRQRDFVRRPIVAMLDQQQEMPWMFAMVAVAFLAVPGADNDQGPQLPAACPASSDSLIMVCADRDKPSIYRIDPAIAGMNRGAEPGGRPPAHQAVGEERCPPHGIRTCPGTGTIPISAIALVAAKSALLAVNGEDWRQPLRTQADHYEEYRAIKAKQQRRRDERKVRFGVISDLLGR